RLAVELQAFDNLPRRIGDCSSGVLNRIDSFERPDGIDIAAGPLDKRRVGAWEEAFQIARSSTRKLSRSIAAGGGHVHRMKAKMRENKGQLFRLRVAGRQDSKRVIDRTILAHTIERQPRQLRLTGAEYDGDGCFGRLNDSLNGLIMNEVDIGRI